MLYLLPDVVEADLLVAVAAVPDYFAVAAGAVHCRVEAGPVEPPYSGGCGPLAGDPVPPDGVVLRFPSPSPSSLALHPD